MDKKIKELSNKLAELLNVQYGEIKLIIHNKDVKNIKKIDNIKLN